MCGIVGLYLKNEKYESQLGRYLEDMLISMTDRGPDSAGFAVYGDKKPNQIKVTLRNLDESNAEALSKLSTSKTVIENHIIFGINPDALDAFLDAVAVTAPHAVVSSVGETMTIFKETGLPKDISARYGLSAMSGTHGIGHTRIATESAVTSNGAHPFTAGNDLCLVHNGSLSNHRTIGRRLAKAGISLMTDNDSEVAANFLSWKLQEGMSLGQALEASLEELDGFYTFVTGTQKGFAVLRDPIACKPAVMAETDDYVAIGSEYRALSNLPGIENAHLFEPEPARVYTWERN